MDAIVRVRRAFHVQGWSVKRIGRELHMSRNTVRPHGSLGYKPAAPEVFIPAFAARAALQPQPAMQPALAPRPSSH